MSDIVERLRVTGAERQRTTAHDDPTHYLHVVAKISNADGLLLHEAAATITRLRERLEIDQSHPYDGIYCRNETIRLQDAEITRLTAENARLNKSRNKWGQKYNKLLEQHKVTVSQLTAAVWSDSEECRLLTAENERLRAALELFACDCIESGNLCPSPQNCRNYIARAALEEKQ